MQLLVGRRIYLLTMVIIPIAMSLFFLSLLNPGLPLKVPTAIIDLDNSTMSRKITRSLSAMETIEIAEQAKQDAIDKANQAYEDAKAHADAEVQDPHRPVCALYGSFRSGGVS